MKEENKSQECKKKLILHTIMICIDCGSIYLVMEMGQKICKECGSIRDRRFL